MHWYLDHQKEAMGVTWNSYYTETLVQWETIKHPQECGKLLYNGSGIKKGVIKAVCLPSVLGFTPTEIEYVNCAA